MACVSDQETFPRPITTPPESLMMLRTNLAWAVLLTVLIPSGWIMLSALSAGFSLAAGLVIGFGLLALISPTWSLATFFMLLPLAGGDYPGTPSNVLFYQVYSAWVLGFGIRWIVHLIRCQGQVPLGLANPIILLGVIFLLTGIMSLTSLPIDEMGVRYQQLLPDRALKFISLKELWVLYPVSKVLLLWQSLLVLLILGHFPTRWRPAPVLWLSAILTGFLLTAIAGLLDHYTLIDLSSMRPVYGGIAPSGYHLRLQSFFGHPAWFAMYATMAIPSVLVLLRSPLSRTLQVIVIVAILVLGEYVLILTFSRGSWISYLFTLISIWLSFTLLRPGSEGARGWDVLKRAMGKIMLSLPISIGISMVTISLIGNDSYLRYLDRAKQIANVSERTAYVAPSLTLLAEHPILGGGHDSFSYRYALDYILPSGPHWSPNSPLANTYNNAHNTYLQLLTGRGVFGIISWLAFIAMVIWTPLMVIRRDFEQATLSPDTGSAAKEKIFTLFTLCSVIPFVLYGLFDDVFYTPSLTALLFTLMGLSIHFEGSPIRFSARSQRIAGWMLLAVFLAHVTWEYGYPAPTRTALEVVDHEGCYPPDPLPNGQPGPSYWCSDRFQIALPATPFMEGRFAFQQVVPVSKPNPTEPVSIEISGSMNAPLRLFLPGGRPSWLVIPLQDQEPDPVHLEIKVDQVTIPVLDPNVQSLDRRRQSLMIIKGQTRPVAALAQKALCGPQTDLGQGWHGQWCAQGGTLDAGMMGQKGLMGFKAADPTTSPLNPLYVWIAADHMSPRLIEVKDAAWHTFESLGMGRAPSGLAMAANRSWQAPGSTPVTLEFALGVQTGPEKPDVHEAFPIHKGR